MSVDIEKVTDDVSPFGGCVTHVSPPSIPYISLLFYYFDDR